MESIFLKKMKDEKGQNLVEFALIVGLLLALVLGIVEFGRAWYTADRLKNAANIAARTAAVTAGNSSVKENAGKAAAAKAMGVSVGAVNAKFSISTTVKATVKKYFKSVVPVMSALGGNIPIFGNHTISRDATYRNEQ